MMLHMYRRSPKLGTPGPRPLVTGAVLTPYKYVPSHMCHLAKCGCSGSDCTSVITEIRRENNPTRSAFQGHPRSSEPIRIDRLPVSSTVTMGPPISYRFLDKRRKLRKLPNAVYLTWKRGDWKCWSGKCDTVKKCRGGKCGSVICSNKMQGWNMREW